MQSLGHPRKAVALGAQGSPRDSPARPALAFIAAREESEQVPWCQAREQQEAGMRTAQNPAGYCPGSSQTNAYCPMATAGL